MFWQNKGSTSLHYCFNILEDWQIDSKKASQIQWESCGKNSDGNLKAESRKNHARIDDNFQLTSWWLSHRVEKYALYHLISYDICKSNCVICPKVRMKHLWNLEKSLFDGFRLFFFAMWPTEKCWRMVGSVSNTIFFSIWKFTIATCVWSPTATLKKLPET